MKYFKLLVDRGHGINTLGKCSPDRTLVEWEYADYIARQVVKRCKLAGIDAQLLVPEQRDISLTTRCNRVNNWCYKLGKQNVILLSIHVNAAGMGKNWLKAGGWCCFTSKGETKSDTIAEYLYDSAEINLAEYIRTFDVYKKTGFYDSKQRPVRTDKSDGDRDWEANFAMVHNTLCPAVLTENLFQDNRQDVKYLLSEEGKEAIINLHVDGIINYIKSVK